VAKAEAKGDTKSEAKSEATADQKSDQVRQASETIDVTNGHADAQAAA
jgi:hypothetical protein